MKRLERFVTDKGDKSHRQALKRIAAIMGKLLITAALLTACTGRAAQIPASGGSVTAQETTTPPEEASPTMVTIAKTIDDYADYMLPSSDAEPGDGAIRATWYGTCTVLLDDGETQILFDAFITRPSLEDVVTSLETGKATIQTDTDVVDEWLARPEVGDPAAIYTSHSHHDHALDIAYIANQTGAQVYGSDSTLNLASGGGVPDGQLSRYHFMEPMTFGDFTVTVLPMRHEQNQPPLPDDRNLTIDEPLEPPYRFVDLVEGGSSGILVQHGDNAILMACNSYILGSLYDLHADVVFLGINRLEDQRALDTWYNQIVGEVQPYLVISQHWDNPFLPLSEHQVFASDDLGPHFDYTIQRLSDDGRRFGLMQGYQSILLFGEDRLGLE